MKTAFVVSFWADWNLVYLAAMVAAGLFVLPALLFRGIRERRESKTPNTFVGVVLPLLMLPVWLTLSGMITYSYVSLSRGLVAVYNSGNYRMIEGPVKVLHQQPWAGHAAGDLVEVAGERFVISFFTMAPAYTDSIAHGGVIREENRVRLFVADGYILRVDYEEKKEPNHTAEPASPSRGGSS